MAALLLSPARAALAGRREGFVRACRDGWDLRCDGASTAMDFADFMIAVLDTCRTWTRLTVCLVGDEGSASDALAAQPTQREAATRVSEGDEVSKRSAASPSASRPWYSYIKDC